MKLKVIDLKAGQSFDEEGWRISQVLENPGRGFIVLLAEEKTCLSGCDVQFLEDGIAGYVDKEGKDVTSFITQSEHAEDMADFPPVVPKKEIPYTSLHAAKKLTKKSHKKK